MAAPQRRGFTLVELLVVITIIGMLMALLLPAIQSAREAGRKNTCANNMRNNAFALIQGAESRKSFPGYASTISKTTSAGVTTYYRVSWVVNILPNLEQNALYQNWQDPTKALTLPDPNGGMMNMLQRQQYISQISVLVCPSFANPDLGDNPLSYVVNTGSAQKASDNFASLNWPEDGNSGVCFNQAQRGTLPSNMAGPDPMYAGQPIKKVGLDFLNTNDGTSHTVLMSENLQTGNWATDPNNTQATFNSDMAVRQSVGFVWYVTGNANNYGLPQAMSIPAANNGMNYDAGAIEINSARSAVSGPLKPGYNYGDANPSGLAYARPASNHPGGVNAMFADNHLQFLNEELPYHVYTQLMTPYQKQTVIDYKTAGTPPGSPIKAGNWMSGGAVTSSQGPWLYTLNEADYQ